MPNDTTLKPCCNKPQLITEREGDVFYTSCLGCGKIGTRIDARQTAIDAFNAALPRHTAPQGHEGLRPCEWMSAADEIESGFFHLWKTDKANVMALVEWCDGSMSLESIDSLRFTDRTPAVERETDRG